MVFDAVIVLLAGLVPGIALGVHWARRDLAAVAGRFRLDVHEDGHQLTICSMCEGEWPRHAAHCPVRELAP